MIIESNRWMNIDVNRMKKREISNKEEDENEWGRDDKVSDEKEEDEFKLSIKEKRKWHFKNYNRETSKNKNEIEYKRWKVYWF